MRDSAGNASSLPIISSRASQLAAFAEVLAAFAFVHVSYRALKAFTVLDRWEAAANTNFIPGTVMLLFTVTLLLLARRNFEYYGLTLKRWRADLKIALG